MENAGLPNNRQGALDQLDRWMPHARNYAKERNYDLPGHPNVSLISTALQRRLITEKEVVRAILEKYPVNAVEKFLQEIHWRTYWKGWLEGRPAIWQEYLTALDRIDPGTCIDYPTAVEGRTGIECFDHWVCELNETGYLHNHARMWFASIWIFTLRLPWELGAHFFEKRLLDSDAASNTLSWRWVAGRQTQGKTYVATAENIQRYTNGRFFPKGQLNEKQEPINHPVQHPAASYKSYPALANLPSDPQTGLWIHAEDLSLERIASNHKWQHIAITPTNPRSHSTAQNNLNTHAANDALERISRGYGAILPESTPEALLRWSVVNDLRHIVAAIPFVGPWLPVAAELERIAGKRGIQLHWFRRQWDTELFPHAHRGFFPFWKHCLTRL